MLNTQVGKVILAQELVDQYDAVVLCAGATKERGLDVEGKELKGAHFAVDFLNSLVI